MSLFSNDEDDFEQLDTAATSTVKSSSRSGPSLKARAIDFLSRREHSRVELKRKLFRHSEDQTEVEALLDELERDNWLSDERFAHSLLNRRAHKLGTARVLQELRQNGVAPEHIETVKEQLQDTEFERALEVWSRKFGEAPTDPKTQAKQYRFMVSRGFSPGILRRILDDLKDIG